VSTDAIIELRDVDAGLAAISRAATQRKASAFAEIKPLAKADLRQRGKDRATPDGQAWRGPTAASVRAAKRDRRRNRRPGDLGKLPSAWKSKVEPEQLRFVNAVDWAWIHDASGRAGNGARIPSRGFAGFSAEFAEKAMGIWAETVLGAW
jgi:hypothetical protein